MYNVYYMTYMNIFKCQHVNCLTCSKLYQKPGEKISAMKGRTLRFQQFLYYRSKKKGKKWKGVQQYDKC